METRFDFPTNYPTELPPTLSLENTVEFSDEVVAQIASECETLMLAYRDRKRSSLEAALRYLLGEHSLTDSLALLKAKPDGQMLEMDLDSDMSSSDEDDESEVNKIIGIQTQSVDMNDSMLAVSNAEYNVPLPKACGAYWADDGRLVCFFPPKQEKPSSLLGSLGLRAGEQFSRNFKSIFEGFGRLHNGSSATKRASSNLESIESIDSDFESLSTSSGSSSDEGIVTPELQFMPSVTLRVDPSDRYRALSVDDSQRSSGRGPRNYISIHDCADLLPAKQYLAADYTLSADLSHCCLHNAAVARVCGELDVADVWTFANLILRDEVPSELIEMPLKGESIIVAVRRAVSPLKEKDSGIDLSHDHMEERKKSRVQWGQHPFGRHWLVRSLCVYR
ncbi:MAG: hypothetical protein Q9190_006382 [Brigantiaea leucoxantha]